ncbi:MAG: hypothetical protein QXW94_00405 [Desulfurococcaceae archaeon]
MSLDQYIVCSESCSLRYLESLAMVGLASGARVEQCDNASFAKLLLELFNGFTVSSSCSLKQEVERSLKIVKTYIEFASRSGALGKLKVIEAP